MRCSREVSVPCRCGADAPKVGSPSYGLLRSHPDAGDLEALDTYTKWLKAGVPCLHPRFADGEFWSILKRSGVNTDGMSFYGDTLGVVLHTMLSEISSTKFHSKYMLVGGDWSIPEHTRYLEKNGFINSIPWCPSSIWVNGVVSGKLAEFLEALVAEDRPKVLIANGLIQGAADFLRSMFFEIQAKAAWQDRQRALSFIRRLPKDSIVLYCAGMASEGFIFDAFKVRPDLTQLDLGHLFDGAFEIRNRSWLRKEGVCRRRDTYFDRYVPVILGKQSSFGSF